VVEDLPVRRKSTLGESGFGGGRTLEGWSVEVFLSRRIKEDRCEEIYHFRGRTLQRKVRVVKPKLPKAKLSESIVTIKKMGGCVSEDLTLQNDFTLEVFGGRILGNCQISVSGSESKSPIL
jgi:hypothetical protein